MLLPSRISIVPYIHHTKFNCDSLSGKHWRVQSAAGLLFKTCAANMQHVQARHTATHTTMNRCICNDYTAAQPGANKRKPWAQQHQQMLQKWLALWLCGAEGSGRLGPGQLSSNCAAAPLNSCQPPEEDGTADPWSRLQHLKQLQCALPLLAAPTIRHCLMLPVQDCHSNIYFSKPQINFEQQVKPAQQEVTGVTQVFHVRHEYG